MHDAFLLLSYGAPEIRSEVMPFLENLFKNQNVPPQVLEKAARQYDELEARTGQFSPLPQHCRELLGEILGGLRDTSPKRKRGGLGKEIENDMYSPQPLYWGNLFWHPLLRDTIEEMHDDGVKKAVAFLTSPFDSQVSRDRYLDEIQRVRTELGPGAPEIEVLPAFGMDPLYHRAVADRILEAAAYLTLEHGTEFTETKIIFTAHSLPLSDTKAELYRSQIQAACSSVLELLQNPCEYELAFQSRGRKTTEWLGPDLIERIEQIKPRAVLIVPIGFLLENKETVYDLDITAIELCEEHQIPVIRAATAGTHPAVIQMIYQ